MKKILLSAMSLATISTVFAQAANSTPVKTVTSTNNLLAIMMLIITIILALVIFGMGQVLVAFGRQLLDKNKAASKTISIFLVIALSLFAQASFAQDANAAQAVKVLPNYGGLSETTFYFFVIVIGIEVVAILFLAFLIHRMYHELMPQKEKASTFNLKFWWSGIDKKLFTKAVPVEKEADILLDHNYDGIQELDNALPPWWKYGFYITIAIAFIYLLNFHVFGYGKNPTEEYNTEMEKAGKEKEIFESKNKDRIDENNVPMANAAGLATGKEIFTANCWPCHGKLGEGGTGPNLTDDYWLHKGSLNDVYQSIKHGYPEKGMQAWSIKFTPKEISYLAGYVKSLRGTNPPNSKAPQGEIFVESFANPVADSAKTVKKDSTVKK